MEEIVNLPGLARGAAVELWAEELKKVAANILDVNTDPKATREITLKATILPNEDRTNASDFVLRLRGGGKEGGGQPMVALFEADGGAWKAEAIGLVVGYLKAQLEEIPVIG